MLPYRYRHQLNHTPKQIYACDFPECNRTFVRLDLCNRHRDRHTAKGSSLNRKDSVISHVSATAGDRPSYAGPGSASPETNRPGTGYANVRPAHGMSYQHQQQHKDTGAFGHGPGTPPGYPMGGHTNGMDGMMDNMMNHDGAYGQRQSYSSPHPQQRQNVPTPAAPYMSPVSNQHGYHGQPQSAPHSATYVNQANFAPFNLPPSDFSANTASSNNNNGNDNGQRGGGGNGRDGQQYAPTTSAEFMEQHGAQQSGEMMLLDQMSMPGTIPVFGSDSVLSKSPYVTIPEDFVAYLFNTSQQGDQSPMPGQMVTPNYGHK